jgi:hypothetical protein
MLQINVFLVLYFDRIPLWGNFLITIAVGLLVGLGVMIIVKPRLKKSIEGIIMTCSYRFMSCLTLDDLYTLATLKKKHGIDMIDGQPQLKKTDGRFETYTGRSSALIIDSYISTRLDNDNDHYTRRCLSKLCQ